MSAQPEINQAAITRIGNPLIPRFEGVDVDSVAVVISGLSKVPSETMPVFGVDDRVQLMGEFKCIGVRHQVDKNGNLQRVQVLAPISLDTAPYDPADPSDDGVTRAR